MIFRNSQRNKQTTKNKVRLDVVVRFPGTVGTIPLWGCSSVGRAPALQAGGHGFESHHLHQRRKRLRGTKGQGTVTEWAHSSGG